jgi:uncharacterized membrane protein
MQIAAIVAALGCGLVGGIFFAFSTFVMKALGRIAPPQGIAAMQSINIVVINPWFMTAFFGTAVVCVFAIVGSLLWWHEPGAAYSVAGGVLYLAGTIAVTMVCNVPLNNALARVAPASAQGGAVWAAYLSTWTRWNHVRTIAALAASILFIVAFGLGA